MTMDLFILRHGEAGKRSGSRGNDSNRPLTAAGEKEIADIAESFKKIGIDFDIILTSPLKFDKRSGNGWKVWTNRYQERRSSQN